MIIENIVRKEEIAPGDIHILLPQCFQLYIHINSHIMEIFLPVCFQSCLRQLCCNLENVNSCMCNYRQHYFFQRPANFPDCYRIHNMGCQSAEANHT